MKNASNVGLGRLSSRFQKNAWKARWYAPERVVWEAVKVKPKAWWKVEKLGMWNVLGESQRQWAKLCQERSHECSNWQCHCYPSLLELTSHPDLTQLLDKELQDLMFIVLGFTCFGPVLFYPYIFPLEWEHLSCITACWEYLTFLFLWWLAAKNLPWDFGFGLFSNVETAKTFAIFRDMD